MNKFFLFVHVDNNNVLENNSQVFVFKKSKNLQLAKIRLIYC